jgi:hypothetical protein
MQSEPDPKPEDRRPSTPPEGTSAESVMASLVALNKWLIKWDDRPDAADPPA